MKLCACGCGTPVSKPTNRVVRGHNGRLPESRAMYDDPAHRQKIADSRRAVGNDALRGRPSPKSPEHRAAIAQALRARAAQRPAERRIPARDGDTRQAHDRIRSLVRAGILPRPADVPCTDCGQRWAQGLSRHEYDHHHGYDAAHQECAEVVCSTCHHAREKARGRVRKSVVR